MSKQAFIRAILVWFAILAVAVGNGALREKILANVFDATAARFASGIILCAVILVAATLSARWLGARTERVRWLVGVLWLSLTLVFEVAVGYAEHQSWDRLLDAYRFQGGNLWPLVLLTTLIAPWAGARLRGMQPRMDAAHSLEKFIAAYGEAWNRHDVEAILAMHTEDSVFENHTSGGKAVGKAAIREVLRSVFTTFPDIRFDARRVYVRDGVVTQEWTASGTLAVAYTSGGVTVQPTGRKISWNGVDVIPFSGSLVARKDVYVDSMSFLRALGFKTISL